MLKDCCHLSWTSAVASEFDDLINLLGILCSSLGSSQSAAVRDGPQLELKLTAPFS